MKRRIRFGFMACALAMFAPAAVRAQDAVDDSLDAELLEGLTPAEPLRQEAAGEDLGAPESPLARLAGKMREVGGWLGQVKLGPPTQRAQQEIIADLDRLIAQQQKQCQGGGKKPGSKPGSKPGNKPGTSTRPGEAGTTAAADSTDEMRPGENEKATLANPQDLLRKVWGHLPERLRDQMMQNPNERFLPQYEPEIEAYYERLIELDEKQ